MRSLARAVANLLRIWWAVDRIRASPAEARLFELQPPCVTMIEGETVEVLNRCVRETPEGPRIIYRCVRAGGPDRLVVRPAHAASRASVQWIGPSQLLQTGSPAWKWDEDRETC